MADALELWTMALFAEDPAGQLDEGQAMRIPAVVSAFGCPLTAQNRQLALKCDDVAVAAVRQST